MEQGEPWIAIVDDDPSVLKSLNRTLRIRGFETKIFKSAYEFLAALSGEAPACLILDVLMPGMTGPELHHHLVAAGIHIPTIAIATFDEGQEWSYPADIVTVLSKPLLNEALFDAMIIALQPANERHSQRPGIPLAKL